MSPETTKDQKQSTCGNKTNASSQRKEMELPLRQSNTTETSESDRFAIKTNTRNELKDSLRSGDKGTTLEHH